MAMIYAFVGLCLSGGALAQITTSGACPDVRVKSNLQLSQLSGRWFEQARFFALYELNSKCQTFDYVPIGNYTGSVVNTFNSTVTGMEQIHEIEVHIPDHKEPAKSLVKIPLSPIGGNNNLWVLGTDYDSYAVVYSCTVSCSLNLQYAWIMTREQIPDKSIMDRTYKIISRNNIDRSYFIESDQVNCNQEQPE